MLRDTKYVKMVKEIVAGTVQQYRLPNQPPDTELENIRFTVNDQLFFETLKLMIRSKTIPYSAKLKRQKIETEQILKL